MGPSLRGRPQLWPDRQTLIVEVQPGEMDAVWLAIMASFLEPHEEVALPSRATY